MNRFFFFFFFLINYGYGQEIIQKLPTKQLFADDRTTYNLYSFRPKGEGAIKEVFLMLYNQKPFYRLVTKHNAPLFGDVGGVGFLPFSEGSYSKSGDTVILVDTNWEAEFRFLDTSSRLKSIDGFYFLKGEELNKSDEKMPIYSGSTKKSRCQEQAEEFNKEEILLDKYSTISLKESEKASNLFFDNRYDLLFQDDIFQLYLADLPLLKGRYQTDQDKVILYDTNLKHSIELSIGKDGKILHVQGNLSEILGCSFFYVPTREGK
jgi:hypothetical protein